MVYALGDMKKICFCDNWIFYKVTDEASAKKVDLPHDAMLLEKRSIESPAGKGGAWFLGGDYAYEKEFEVLNEWVDKKIVFELEGVYKDAEVYLNDQKVAQRPYGYTNFYVDATPFLLHGKVNTIKVLAFNSDLPNTRWYSGAGIYRPVNLFILEKEHISLNGIKIKTLSHSPAVIEVSVKTEGEGTVEIEVLEEDEVVAMTAITSPKENTTTIEIPNAKLWDAENPNLYTARIKFKNHIEEVKFGIRTIECDAKSGLKVNGKKVLLKGACVHHDNGLLGAVAHPFAEWRKVKLLKDNGYNAIRSSHNPCSKAMLDACDSLGVYMVDEYIDMWYIHKNKYDYAKYVDEWFRQDLADMIDKDYNHPSVIMYSIGNEVSESAQARGIQLIKDMRDFIREIDTTKPVTCGINLFFNYLSSLGFGVHSNKKAEKQAKPKNKRKTVGSEFFNNLAGIFGAKFMKWGASLGGSDRKTKKAFAELDVAGYNYGEKRYKKDVKKYPDRVILGTETFSFDAYKFIEFSKNNPALIGDFVWTGIDYLGEVGIGAHEYVSYAPDFRLGEGWIAAGAGRLDITGKPSGEMAYTRVAFELDKIRIAVTPVDTAKQKYTRAAWRMTNAQESWSWNGQNGKKTNVEVYARADKVQLFINGKSVAIKKMKNDCRVVFKNSAYFDGEIVAVGYDKDEKEISRTALKTAGEETQLSLLPEKLTITKDELCYVRLAYTDKNKVTKPLCRGDIKIEVANGTLLGLGSGCPYNPRGFLTDTTDTYYGEALAIIKPENDANLITINATSSFGDSSVKVAIDKDGE